jgi:hypothetical protein
VIELSAEGSRVGKCSDIRNSGDTRGNSEDKFK